MSNTAPVNPVSAPVSNPVLVALMTSRPITPKPYGPWEPVSTEAGLTIFRRADPFGYPEYTVYPDGQEPPVRPPSRYLEEAIAKSARTRAARGPRDLREALT